LFVFVAGPSLLALNLITTWISWFGQVCWYRVAREELPATDKTAAIVGMMLVPSVVFWGAAFAKEALVLGAFGVLGLSTYRVLRSRQLHFVAGIAIGGVGVALLKPYTLLPFVLAVGAFIYADRAWRTEGALRIRPAYLLVAAALSVGGVAAFVAAFPEYEPENLAETVSHQQAAWDANNGGSTIERVGGEATTGTQQLPLAPLALANSLFRPFFFEARGAPALGAAAETTLLALLSLWLLANGRAAARALPRAPFLVASVIFVLVFAFAVGLTTSNLGSLSRYRVPMMPFYATVLLVLGGRVRESLATRKVRAPLLASRRRSPA
jgi:hypothetical protein